MMSVPGPEDPRIDLLRRALQVHEPRDARESLSRDIVLAELSALAHPFDRNADRTHVTASAVVIGPRGVLLHRHRRLHRWLQPGGHMEAGESTEDAALRESEEETGLSLAHPSTGPLLLHVDVHEAGDHVHLDIRYLLLGPDEEPAPPAGESQEVAWFSWDDAGALADDALTGALRSARRLIAAGNVRVPGTTTGDDDVADHEEDDG